MCNKKTKLNMAILLAVILALAGSAAAQNTPPEANAGEDQTIYLGDSITLHGTATDAEGHPIVSWQWEVISAPAGSIYGLSDADTPDALFTTDTLGDYVITLIVSDGFDWSDPDAVLVTVVENQPPVAVAAASPTSGTVPLLVNFEGTGSSDPEEGPLGYYWSFDDGQYSTEQNPTHEYQISGVYVATLKVTDDHGNIDFDAVEITLGYLQAWPKAYDFGDVQIGNSSSTIITITCLGGGSHHISDISLQQGPSGDFAITANPAPMTIEHGESNDVEITFTPSVEGYVSATLQITSDDPLLPLIEVPLGGEGVFEELPPEGQIAAVLSFIDASVEAGSLAGEGPGGSAENRLNALQNMIEACGDLIADELYDEACDQLAAALKKCDGQPKPPDFVTGDAAAVVKSMIEVLRTTLECQ